MSVDFVCTVQVIMRTGHVCRFRVYCPGDHEDRACL